MKMIFTLPVSNLISKENYNLIPGVKALEFKDTIPLFANELERLFHSSYGVVQEEFILYFDSIVGYLNDNNFKLFSFDLGPAAKKVRIKDYYYIVEDEILSSKEIREKIKINLDYVKSKFHGKIAMENLNYFPTSAYTYVCEGDFIKDILVQNDVYLVLDIAHAIISSHNLKLNLWEYISSLPLDRIIEIHLSSPGFEDGKRLDIHNFPDSEVLDILKFIMKQVVEYSCYITVEYYKDFYKLQEIYKRLIPDSISDNMR